MSLHNRTSLDHIIANWDDYELEFKLLFAKRTWEIFNLVTDKWLFVDVYRKNCKNNWVVEREFIGNDPVCASTIQLNHLLYRFLIDFNNMEKSFGKIK